MGCADDYDAFTDNSSYIHYTDVDGFEYNCDDEEEAERLQKAAFPYPESVYTNWQGKQRAVLSDGTVTGLGKMGGCI